MRINLGDRVRDVVNEFEGVATTVADHLTGCRRYWVETRAKDGESKGMWCDEARLVVVEERRDRQGEENGLVVAPPPAS